MAEKEHPQVAALQKQYDEIEKRNKEAMDRQDNSKPTPTQAENDLARLGALTNTDEKEDHGGEPEPRAMAAGSPDPAYQTRAQSKRKE